MTASPTPSRPRVVEIGFWVLIAGAVLLIFGGLLAATVSYQTARSAIDVDVSDAQVRTYLNLYRAMGVGSVLSGGALAFLASRSRRGDARFRRAAVALALAIALVLVLLAVGLGVAQPVMLLSLVPIAVGTIMLTRRSAAAWFHRDPV